MAERESDDHALLRFRKMSRPARVVYARPRTFIAVAIGIVAFFLLPDSLRLVTRLLMSWDGFITHPARDTLRSAFQSNLKDAMFLFIGRPSMAYPTKAANPPAWAQER